jgi:hypothetical protein
MTPDPFADPANTGEEAMSSQTNIEGHNAAPMTEDTDDSSLIAKFTQMTSVPPYLLAAFREMDLDRKYVSIDWKIAAKSDAVINNIVLRNQQTLQSYLGLIDPQPEVASARKVRGVVDDLSERFAESMEIFLEQQTALAELGPNLDGLIQDMSTNGFGILKTTLQSDFMKDPIGKNRFGDQQDNVARYMFLQKAYASKTFNDDSPQFNEMKDLEQTIRLYAAGKIEEQIKAVPVMVPQQVPILDPYTGQPIMDPATGQPVTQTQMVQDPQDPRSLKRQAIIDGEQIDLIGLPELEQYVGFVVDQVQPEDIRWDWSITRPENWHQAAWIAHRIFMRPEDVVAKFQLSMDDMSSAEMYNTKGQVVGTFATSANDFTIDPTDRTDLERQWIDGHLAVWEVWHKQNGRRYVFMNGIKKFLINEAPQAVGRRWYPFFFYYKNRVSGQILPLSDVALQRNLQDEYNMFRSWDREYRRAALPSVFVAKGAMSAESIELYRRRVPFAVIEFENPDAIAKYFKESTTIPYNPALTNTGPAERDLQMAAGIPAASAGVTESGITATQSSIANGGLTQSSNSLKAKANKLVTDIYQYWAEIGIKVFDEEHIKKLCGVEASWPKLTVEEMYTHISIQVRGGISEKPGVQAQMAMWQGFASTFQTLASAQQVPMMVQGMPVQLNAVEVLREMFSAMGIRKDFRRFLMLPQLPTGPMGGTPPAPGSPMPPAQQEAEAAAGGQAGGAPPMSSRPPPTDPSQIPNSPAESLTQ